VSVAQITTVRRGSSSEAAGNIKITETEAGAFIEGSEVVVGLANLDGRIFAAQGSILERDMLRFRSANVRELGGDDGLDWDWEMKDGQVVIEIKSQSENTPAEFEIYDAVLVTSELLPWLDRDAYPVVAHGNAIANNWVNEYTTATLSATNLRAENGLFTGSANRGIRADYVRTTNEVVVGGFDPAAEFQLSLNDGWAIINSERIDIPADMRPIFDDSTGGTVLVSVRFISEHMGLQTPWFARTEGGPIVVDVEDAGRHIARFEAGQTFYVQDGLDRQMTYNNGAAAAALMKDNRMFIPIRFLGRALGVPNDKIDFVNGIVYFNMTAAEVAADTAE
jgi:hypothetical protein